MPRIKDNSKIDHIKDKALEIILRDGISGLNMTKLAKQSGVATGTFYIYFKDKDELINALFKETVLHAINAFKKGVNPELSVLDKLSMVWYNIFNHYLEFPQESAFNEQYYRSSYLREEVKEETETFFTPIFKLLEEGIQQGLFRNVGSKLLAAHVIGGIHEFVKWELKGLIKIDDKMKKRAYEMALAGVIHPDYKGK